MDLASIKAALNHRSLTQAEQWALVAEMRRSQDERDALAAQVAALVAWCSHVGAPVTSEQSYGAAARYLAADRVAKAVSDQSAALDRKGMKQWLTEIMTADAQAAIAEWRKACCHD